jgi:hypothetical protein
VYGWLEENAGVLSSTQVFLAALQLVVRAVAVGGPSQSSLCVNLMKIACMQIVQFTLCYHRADFHDAEVHDACRELGMRLIHKSCLTLCAADLVCRDMHVQPTGRPHVEMLQ